MHFHNTDVAWSNILGTSRQFTRIELTSNQIKLIENAEFILPGHKAQLIQLATGSRLTTELWPKRYVYDQRNDKYVPNSAEVELIRSFLKNLPFFVSEIELERPMKREDRPQEATENSLMFQISTSQIVDNFIRSYWKTFSSFEQGALYGYPTTAILAFMNLTKRFPLEKRAAYTVAMNSIGPGFYSDEFFEDEKSHYEDEWRKISTLSPEIARECEVAFS
jgi:hypothetical protein